jgi:AraC-like DNA-binding protein
MESAFFTYGAQRDGCPIRSVLREGSAAQALPHKHDCGQLLYAEHGATLLETNGSLVRLAPGRAAWIPMGSSHRVLIERPYRNHSLYVDPAFQTDARFSVVAVSSLLRELIIDASHWPPGNDDLAQRIRKAHVILDELARAPTLAQGMPVPHDGRIAGICRALERDPANRKPLAQWAREVGASEKTIQRLFVDQTGLSFQQWRHFVKMTAALDLHRQGLRLLDVAIALGYATEGAYAHAFRQFYGYPPSQARQRADAPVQSVQVFD